MSSNSLKIYNDMYRKQTTIKNTPPNVIMQKYLAPCETSRHFDWLYILPMNDIVQPSCKTTHTLTATELHLEI